MEYDSVFQEKYEKWKPYLQECLDR
jgi:hypothetical protein